MTFRNACSSDAIFHFVVHWGLRCNRFNWVKMHVNQNGWSPFDEMAVMVIRGKTSVVSSGVLRSVLTRKIQGSCDEKKFCFTLLISCRLVHFYYIDPIV